MNEKTQHDDRDDRPPRDVAARPATGDQPDEDRPAARPKEPNPLLREGADALDAADIEDPRHQR